MKLLKEGPSCQTGQCRVMEDGKTVLVRCEVCGTIIRILDRKYPPMRNYGLCVTGIVVFRLGLFTYTFIYGYVRNTYVIPWGAYLLEIVSEVTIVVAVLIAICKTGKARKCCMGKTVDLLDDSEVVSDDEVRQSEPEGTPRERAGTVDQEKPLL